MINSLITSSTTGLQSPRQLSIVLNELQHTRVLLRVITALLLSTMFFTLVDPAIYILTVSNSFYARLGLTLKSPELLAACFCAIACTLIPFFVVQIFFPDSKARRTAAKIAVFGLFAAGSLWIFLSWFIWNWDIPSIATIFVRLGLSAYALSVALALSLNQEMMRRYMEHVR